MGYILKIEKSDDFDEFKADALIEYILEVFGHDMAFDEETERELTLNIPSSQ